MKSSPAERRRSRRARVRQPLQAHLSLEAEILQLSSRGMMVRLPFAPPLGSHHGFGLVVDGEPFDVNGVVRNVAPLDDEGGAYHVGVEFLHLDAHGESLLDRFVSRKLKSS